MWTETKGFLNLNFRPLGFLSAWGGGGGDLYAKLTLQRAVNEPILNLTRAFSTGPLRWITLKESLLVHLIRFSKLHTRTRCELLFGSVGQEAQRKPPHVLNTLSAFYRGLWLPSAQNRASRWSVGPCTTSSTIGVIRHGSIIVTGEGCCRVDALR